MENYFKLAAPAWFKTDPLDVEKPALRFYNYIKAQNITVPLFHGTSNSRLRQIHETGYMLATQHHGDGQELNVTDENSLTGGAGKIFFTRSKVYASMYCAPAKKGKNDKMCIIEANVPLYMVEELRIALLYPDQETYNEFDYDEKLKEIFWKAKKGQTRMLYTWRNETTNEQKLKQIQEFMSEKNTDGHAVEDEDEFTVKTALKAKYIKSVIDESNIDFWKSLIQFFPATTEIPTEFKTNKKFQQFWAEQFISACENNKPDVAEYAMPPELLQNELVKHWATTVIAPQIKANKSVVNCPTAFPIELIFMPEMQKLISKGLARDIKHGETHLAKYEKRIQDLISPHLSEWNKPKINTPQSAMYNEKKLLIKSLQNGFNNNIILSLLTKYPYDEVVLDVVRGSILQKLQFSPTLDVLPFIKVQMQKYFPMDKDLLSAFNKAQSKLKQPASLQQGTPANQYVA